jgi:hypothetical protein
MVLAILVEPVEWERGLALDPTQARIKLGQPGLPPIFACPEHGIADERGQHVEA